jgi:frataxin-like iron-binding protein CyaY
MSSLAHRFLRAQLRQTSFLAARSRSAGAIAKPSGVALQCPQRFAFHASTQAQFAVRRRRGAKHREDPEDSDGGSNENPLKHPPVVDTAEFCEAASALLTKLEKALDPMKAKNDFFVVERTREDIGEILTIDLGPKDGSYRIEMSEAEHMFEYTSPISGKILYILSSSTGEWVGVADGHQFVGLLVRDLIRQCRGLPNL